MKITEEIMISLLEEILYYTKTMTTKAIVSGYIAGMANCAQTIYETDDFLTEFLDLNIVMLECINAGFSLKSVEESLEGTIKYIKKDGLKNAYAAEKTFS